MKTKEEMMHEYKSYTDKILSSKKEEDMMLLKESCDWMFYQATIKNPDMADSVLSHLAEVEINNYLSEHEMMNISKRTINQDGSKGFHWTYGQVEEVLKELGGKLEDYPYYNCYALVTMVNIMYSDHAMSTAMDLGYKTPSEVPTKEMALSCYRKAVEKLKDIDNPRYVRKYFSNKYYDDSPMPNK